VLRLQHLKCFESSLISKTKIFRNDSDIYAPSGLLRPINGATPKEQIWDWDEVVKIASNKTKTAFYLVSNCVTPSKREAYVKQLKNHVNVTERGRCSNVKCDELEKLFDHMENLVVPIVLKKSVYDNIIPTGSFIAVDDFESPRELADYLKYLEKNNTAYLR
ncbi:unnamed protein product, partial [Gongylonema pulchrum]|uniref:Fucosyltransferase n=1 Tax=Gongylonema pulchrum TaxID=637853 RepID=A0A183D2F6_9BILA